jgi:hypothetical protein
MGNRIQVPRSTERPPKISIQDRRLIRDRDVFRLEKDEVMEETFFAGEDDCCGLLKRKAEK